MTAASIGDYTPQIRKVYDQVNGDLNKLNAQVVKHNVKTVLKTTLVYTSIIAAGVFTTIAAATLIGYAYPIAIGKLLLPKIVIALISMRIFEKTFGKIMENKFKSNTDEVLSQLNAKLSQLSEKTTFSVYNPELNYTVNMKLDLQRFESDGYMIKEKKISYNDVEKTYQTNITEVFRKKREELEATAPPMEGGFFSFLTSLLPKRS